jgi:hypothetical protein
VRVTASPPAPIPTIEDSPEIEIVETTGEEMTEFAPELTEKARSTGRLEGAKPAPKGPVPKKPVTRKPVAKKPEPKTQEEPVESQAPLVEVAEESNARLKGTSGALAGVSFHLTGKKQTIGSAADCDIELPGAGLEPHHVRLAMRAGEWVLSDTSATAGIKLNGETLPKKMKAMLSDGDVIAFGDVELEFKNESEDT